MLPIIETERLTRRFVTFEKPKIQGFRRFFARAVPKDLFAVSDLSLAIGAGEKVAFIGPNGAGKSTTLKMLCGLLCPSEGTASVCGYVPWDKQRALARHIGLVFGQRSQLWAALPVEDSFDLLARIYDLDDKAYRRQREKLVALFHLDGFLGQTAKTLSLGQRMRADIAAALLHEPSVLFLDEPTIGLDVTAKALLRDHLNTLAREMETTILLTSHDTDDIEQICQRVILIDHGRMLLDTSLVDLKATYNRHKTLTLLVDEERPVFAHEGVDVQKAEDFRLVLSINSRIVSVERVLSVCLARFSPRDIAINAIPLEDVIKSLYAAEWKKR